MGEILNILAECNMEDLKIVIELNRGSSEKALRSIHIQSETFKVEFDEIEFLKLSTAFLCARRRFEYLKGRL